MYRSVVPAAASNNGMHPTRDTLPLIEHNRAGGRVMPAFGATVR